MREGLEDGHEIREVKPAVQGCQALVREILKGRELKKVNVEMDDIELMCTASDLIQHHHVARDEIADAQEA